MPGNPGPAGGWNADRELLEPLDSPVLRRMGLGGLNMDCMPDAGESGLDELGDT